MKLACALDARNHPETRAKILLLRNEIWLCEAPQAEK